MSVGGEGREAVTIAATRPAGRPGDDAVMQASLVADPGQGTLTWHPDTLSARKNGPVVTRLPGSDSGDSGDVAAALVHLRFSPGSTQWRTRLICVTEDHRTLWRSRSYTTLGAEVYWPMDELRRLEQFGLELRREEFRFPKQVEEAYSGAEPHWRWQDTTHLVIGMVAVLVVAFLVYYVATS